MRLREACKSGERRTGKARPAGKAACTSGTWHLEADSTQPARLQYFCTASLRVGRSNQRAYHSGPVNPLTEPGTRPRQSATPFFFDTREPAMILLPTTHSVITVKMIKATAPDRT